MPTKHKPQATHDPQAPHDPTGAHLRDVEVVRLEEGDCLGTQEAESLLGTLLGHDAYTRLIRHDCDVYKPDGGLLMRFRRNVIPRNIARVAYHALRTAAKATSNRGVAAGAVTDENLPPNMVKLSRSRMLAIRPDGTLSNTDYARLVKSGVVGYYDRYPRIPYCRMTAFNTDHYDEFRAAYPYLAAIDNLYRVLVPDAYARQRAMVERTAQDFVIRGTAFTTVTVNRNWQTAVHRDAGDYADGFGNLAVLEAGRYRGGYLCFPRYRVAVDVRSCDFLAMDVHELHGNLPMVGLTRRWERVSVVCYYRENMWKCGTAEQELERAKRFGAKGMGSAL